MVYRFAVNLISTKMIIKKDQQFDIKIRTHDWHNDLLKNKHPANISCLMFTGTKTLEVPIEQVRDRFISYCLTIESLGHNECV